MLDRLIMLARFGVAALLRPRATHPSPARRHLTLESLPDRVLPSTGLAGATRLLPRPDGVAGFSPSQTRVIDINRGSAYATSPPESHPARALPSEGAFAWPGPAGQGEAPVALVRGDFIGPPPDNFRVFDRFFLDGPRAALLYAAADGAAGPSGRRPESQDAARPAPARRERAEASPVPSVEGNGQSLAAFLSGGQNGAQIADGLADAPAAEAASGAGDAADVLFAVGGFTPNAHVDYVPLHRADFAVAPTYVVGATPAVPETAARPGEETDLSLAAYLVGLDGPTAAADHLFARLALSAGDPGAGVPRLAARPPACEAGRPPWARLDGLLHWGAKGAAAAPAVMIEGLLAYATWRLRPVRRGRARSEPGA